MDAWIIFLASWFAVVGIIYLINKKAVRYFIAIYWKSEKPVVYVEKFTKKFSFVPRRLYLIVVVVLFLLPVFLVIPFIRPTGEILLLQGFIQILVGGTINALQYLISGASVEAAAARSAGVMPIIPGLTLPWDQLPYIAVAIVVGVVAHELMHGYAALRYGIPIRAVGVFSLFYFLSGAFVEPEEEKFKKATTEAKVAVLASGVAINVVIAIVAMLIGLAGAWAGLQGAVLGTSAYGLSPGDRVVAISGCGLDERVYSPDDFIDKVNIIAGLGPLMGISTNATCRPGDKVVITAMRGLERFSVEVDYTTFITTPRILWLYTDGSLYRSGVREGDVVKKVVGCGVDQEVTSSGQLLEILQQIRRNCGSGEVVKFVVDRGGETLVINVTLIEKDGRVYFGLGLGSLPIYGVHEGHVTRQELYNTDFTRLIFWLVVINYGLAVINALPIYPLDGGQLFATLLQRRLGEKRGRAVINLVTWALVFMLSFNIALGLLGEQYRIFQALR